VDLSALAADSVEEEASSRLLAESRRPFDLTCDPPLRASLLRLAPDVHVLVLMIHHIAFDRWSRGLLRRELAVLYSAFAASRPSPLPEPAIQYRDYAAWQHERLRTEALERELTYWRERLGGAAPVLELSSDRPRPAAPTYRGRQVSFTLTDGLLEALGSLSRRERVSRFMTLLAAFNALLARSTGQTDLVVGTPIAGRTLVELSDLIGCFTNTLVLRTDLSGDPTFRELLGRVRQVALGAYAHQELPFEKLVEELQPERSTRHHPLFQVLFNYLDFPAAPLAVPGLRIEDIEMTLDTALVDLGVDIKRAGRTITCYVTGSADLFDAPTVSRLADQYRALLAAVAANPERRISSLPLAPAEGEPDETHRVLQELDEMSEEEAGRLLAELRDDIR